MYYKLKLMRSTRLRSSIIQNQISEIGKIKPVAREINLNADRKRFWLGELKSVEDKTCNHSMPVTMNYFGI